MNAQILQELDKSAQANTEVIDFGIALGRLLQNRDFKRVVMDGYLSKEAVRLVHEKASPQLQGPEQQRAIVSQIDAIGWFNNYLRNVQAAAELAEKSLGDVERTREEVLSEDA